MQTMNTKANLALELLVLLVVVVITSAGVFGLVRAGVLTVKQTTGASVLNADFIPFTREGYLAIQEFEFCSLVTDQFECVEPRTSFGKEDQIHFRFLLESTPFNGEIMVIENYKVIGPSGETVLDVDEKNNFHVDLRSGKETEQVYFKDYFTLGYNPEPGRYSVSLVLENPLLNKKTTLTKTVMVE